MSDPVAIGTAESTITTPPKDKSYGQVLKSSALIGGSSIIEVGVRVARAKAMALLVGPAGIGLLGVYSTISSLVGNLSGLGLKTSGVREIAEAVGTGDTDRIARTVKTLRRVAFVSGLLGGLLLLAASRFIARITFGNEARAGVIALLALTVPLAEISEAQTALVQGMRRIGDLARMSVLGAVYGTVFSIPIVYFLGESGLVPSLVCVSGMSIVTSWWYARKIKTTSVRMTVRETARESSSLLNMGVVFMSSGLMWMGSAYLIRLVILRKIGIDAAGFFQAAWVLGGFYTGLVLRAVAADFYPRVVAVGGNNEECNRLTNEQAEMVLLLTCPGVLATLTFSPIIIQVMYSAKFGPSVSILRWICLGTLLQIAQWSMVSIVIAKGRRLIYFWGELASNVVLVALVWFGVKAFGLDGAGVGFFGMYLLYSFGTYLVIRRLTGFRGSAANRHLLELFLPLVALVFVAPYLVSGIVSGVFGTAITLASGIYSLKKVCQLVGPDRLPNVARRLLALLRLTPERSSVSET